MISSRSVISRRLPSSAAWRSKWWFRPIANTRMEKVNQYAFYEFGTLIGRLRELRSGITQVDYFVGMLNAAKVIERFMDDASYVSLKSSRRSLDKVLAQLKRQTDAFPPRDLEWDSPLSCDHPTLLDELLDAFEKVFAEESQDLAIFVVSQTGTHAQLDLMQRAEDNLPPTVRARLSAEAARDIRDAGKCLVLDCHTASGYHVLRAVERLIIKYVEKVTGKSYGLKNRNWGAYIRVLRAHNADASVIGYLDHMRTFYRNPIIHPEDILDGNEAFSLFNASLSAIIQLDAAIEALP